MITFIDFVNKEATRMWSGKHLAETTAKLARFSAFQGIGKKPLDKITAVDIHDYVGHLQEQGLCENTINHYKAAISRVYKQALDLELVEKAPKITFAKIKGGRVRWMDAGELDLLKAFFDGHQHWWMKHLVAIGVGTGMRLGEILSITPEMVVTDSAGTWISLTDTKNGDDRMVPCPKSVYAALQELDFCPKKHHSHRKFYNSWAEARRHIAPDDSSFVFHTLRHTAATYMANDLQVNTVLIGRILGHRSGQTTAKYVHEKPETLQEIAHQMLS